MSYPTLLSPISLGPLNLPNRVVMGAMHTGLEGLGMDGQMRLATFFARRAEGGTGLLITGGYAPNAAGGMSAHDNTLDSEEQLPLHRPVTAAVHGAGGRILLQILHAGRYGRHSHIVAPSPIRAPISRQTPAELDAAGIETTTEDFVRCARLAKQAGYDGVEIMGGGGYLLAEFLSPATNHRADRWGGSIENRARLPLDIVRRMRAAVGPDFAIVFRLSLLDLVTDGLGDADRLWVASALEKAGVDAINTHSGWHEAQIPTIAACVPPMPFAEFTARLRKVVGIPVIAANRIATPEDAERILASGQGDLVALARPLLADPDFVMKAAAGKARAIMPCIACNQACLDAIFVDRVAGCMVNPGCCRETEFTAQKVSSPKRIAVIGGGAAGMACAALAAERGHRVVLFEANGALGGQLRVGGEVPDKHEFFRLIEAWQIRLRDAGVEVRLKRPGDLPELLAERFDSIVVATGVKPRLPSIPGADGPNVVTYQQLLSGEVEAGPRVAVLGGGRIAFDVAHFLVAAPHGKEDPQLRFRRRWGFDQDGLHPPEPERPARQVWMLKRSPEPFGKNLGKTTGWILRRELKDAGVQQTPGVEYLGIDQRGLRYRLDGAEQRLEVDTIVLCTGQDPVNELFAGLEARGFNVNAIGGARDARELDAVRAFEEGVRLGLSL